MIPFPKLPEPPVTAPSHCWSPLWPKAFEFLAALGFLKGTPTVKLPDSAPELKSE